MKKEKRLKTKRIMVRVEDDLYSAFTEYANKTGITKTKIVEDFLKELLKDALEEK